MSYVLLFLQMVHADKSTGELHRVQFGHWVTRHCPRLLVGLREWTKSLLFPQNQETEEQSSEALEHLCFVVWNLYCNPPKFIPTYIIKINFVEPFP